MHEGNALPSIVCNVLLALFWVRVLLRCEELRRGGRK